MAGSITDPTFERPPQLPREEGEIGVRDSAE
jgi:hypothetical protein